MNLLVGIISSASVVGSISNLVLTDATLTPSAPSSVTVTGTGTTTASASWPAATNATSYTGTTTVGSISVNSTARTASITGGSAGASVTVGITSVNTNGRISMSWTAAPNATGYDIYVNSTLVASNHSTTSYTHTGTTVGSFTVNIRARNATTVEPVGTTGNVTLTQKTSSATNGTGTFSVALPSAPTNLSLSDNTATPSTPSGLTISSVGTTTASASWSAASNATSYTGSVTVGSISVNSGARTASITGGTAGSSFTVSITSVNTNGVIGMTWTAGSGATSYDVYVGGAFVGNTASTSFSYNLFTTGTFSVEVRSRNSAGQSTTGATGSRSITQKTSGAATASSTFTSDTPAQVTGVTATYSVSPCNFTIINWSSASGASTYEIYHDTTGSTPGSPQFTGLTGNGYQHDNSGGRRYYWVRARSSGGTAGAWSSVVFASEGACFQ